MSAVNGILVGTGLGGRGFTKHGRWEELLRCQLPGPNELENTYTFALQAPGGRELAETSSRMCPFITTVAAVLSKKPRQSFEHELTN